MKGGSMKTLVEINDEHDTCEYCGKTGLKRVAWIRIEDGTTVPFGVCCGARVLGVSKGGLAVKAQAVDLAQKWRDAGHSAETIVKAIWNRFGFLVAVKEATSERPKTICIGSFGRITM